VLRQIIDEVMYEIRELTGQDYVDEYASKKAEGIPEAEPAQVAELGATGTDGPTMSPSPAPRRSSAEVLQPRG
jgi:1-acyl-sn-glycerol-3-phosphate acyltransferase